MAIVETETRTVLKVDWAALSKAVELRVMQKLQADLNDWAEDLGMRSMLLGDAGDGLKACELLLKGKWKPVEDHLWSMDTAARDYIYDFIGEVAGEDFFDLVRNNG
jgi:hypothetical protein